MSNETSSDFPYRECPEGLLSPRDMAGYQRAAAKDGIEVPPNVLQHLQGCEACREEWERIARTDRILSSYRRNRAQTIVRELRAVEEWDVPTREPASAEQQKKWVTELAADLAGPVETEPPDVSRLSSDEIVKISDDKLMIDDDAERWQEASVLARAFAKRVERERAEKRISVNIIGDMLSAERVIAGLEDLPEELAEEPGDLRIRLQDDASLAAIASFAASLPEVSFFQISPHLLEKKDGLLIFRSGEYRKRKHEAQTVMQQMAPVSANRR